MAVASDLERELIECRKKLVKAQKVIDKLHERLLEYE